MVEVPATSTIVEEGQEQEQEEADGQETPKRKRRRRRRSRRPSSAAPQDELSFVSVEMDAAQPPVRSAPCSELLDPHSALVGPRDMGALPPANVAELVVGDVVALADVVVEGGQPVLVWHEGVVRSVSGDTLTLDKAGQQEPFEMPKAHVFSAKYIARAEPQQQQQQKKQQQQEKEEKREQQQQEVKRKPLPRTRGVSGVLELLRKMDGAHEQ